MDKKFVYLSIMSIIHFSIHNNLCDYLILSVMYLSIHKFWLIFEPPSSVLQPSPQPLRPSSPAWTKPPWCWSGCLLGIQAAARTWSSTSSVRAVAADGEAAPAAETTFSFCPVSWAWRSPGSTSATCWPTRSTRSRCRLSTECQIRARTPLSTPPSTSPLTRLVSGPICLFLHLILPMCFPLLLFLLFLFPRLFLSLLCRSSVPLHHTLPLQAHNAQSTQSCTQWVPLCSTQRCMQMKSRKMGCRVLSMMRRRGCDGAAGLYSVTSSSRISGAEAECRPTVLSSRLIKVSP